MTVIVRFRSGAEATFAVPVDILALEFQDLVGLVDPSGIKSFRILR